jgi:hypothetical protein
LHREIPALGESYDWVIIDGPPRVYCVAKSAIAAADVVIIPVQPSPYNVAFGNLLWAAKEIVDLITEVRVIKPNLKAVFAVNRKIVGTAIGRDVAAALSSYPSRADFTCCLTALDWGFGVQKTATKLLEVSAKAKENGERYASLTVQNAAKAAERKGPTWG